MPDPSVRARHMKLFLERIGELDAAVRTEILRQIPPADLQLVADATPVSWLPVEINVRATEVVWTTLSPEARDAFFLRLGMEDFESPLLKGIVGTAIRLFGVEPGSLLRFAPKGWTQVFRDQTTLTPKPGGKGSATLTYAGLPAPLAQSRIWMQSVAATMTALFEYTKVKGTVTVRDVDPAAGAMTLVFRWQTGA